MFALTSSPITAVRQVLIQRDLGQKMAFKATVRLDSNPPFDVWKDAALESILAQRIVTEPRISWRCHNITNTSYEPSNWSVQ